MSFGLGAVMLGLAGLERQGKIRPGRFAGWRGCDLFARNTRGWGKLLHGYHDGDDIRDRVQ